MQGTRIESDLRRHIDELLRVGVLTWDVLCEHTPAYDGDEPITADQLPYEDVIAAGLPLEKKDTARLSNGRCYSRDGMRRWAATYRDRNVRPQFPDTRLDLERSDLLLLGYDDAEARALIDGRPSLETVRADAERGDATATRHLRHEQTLAATRAESAHQIEPPAANVGASWFSRGEAPRGTVQWLLRGKAPNSFLIVWRPDSDARGLLLRVNDRNQIERTAVAFDPASGYRIVDPSVPSAVRYPTLTALLVDKNVRWPPDAPPFAGYRHDLSKSEADALLWRQRPGTYVVRRVDQAHSPHRLVISMRDKQTVLHAPVKLHTGPITFGFAAPNDVRAYASVDEYVRHVRAIRPGGAVPRFPLPQVA